MKQGLYVHNNVPYFVYNTTKYYRNSLNVRNLLTGKTQTLPRYWFEFSRPQFEGNFHQFSKAYPELAL